MLTSPSSTPNFPGALPLLRLVEAGTVVKATRFAGDEGDALGGRIRVLVEGTLPR
jgi:hypothetical protein